MSTNKRELLRQGDVILIPEGHPEFHTGEVQLAPKDERGIVLAEGETSGHFHAIVGKGRHKLFTFKEVSTDRLLEIGTGGAEVRVIGGGSNGVDRHTPIALKPGLFLVRIQRRFDSTFLSRQVKD